MPSKLMFIHALTPLHVGTGSALGAVDLPVARERHTQWPLIPGSAVKGVLRAHCFEGKDEDPNCVQIFGGRPPKEGDGEKEREKHLVSGDLVVTDARILAFPVRSLRGVFALVTCPAVLERLARDLKAAGVASEPPKFEIPGGDAGDKHIHCADPKLIAIQNKVILENLDFDVQPRDAKALAEWIATTFGVDQDLTRRIAVISDNQFTHFTRYATEVMARIALDYKTKTVKKGALFNEEALPTETMFYNVLRGSDATFSTLKSKLKDGDATLQFGGDETIGRGICAVRFAGGK